MKRFLIPGFCAAILMSAGPCQADVVRLKNGNVVEGIVEKEDERSLEVNLGFGTATFLKDEVASVEKKGPDAAQALWDGWAQRRREEAARAPEQQRERERSRKAAEALRQAGEQRRQSKDGAAARRVRVTARNGQMIVNAVLNGRQRAALIVDSGAGTTLISRGLADRLGLDVSSMKKYSTRVADGRTVEAALGTLESLKVQDAETKDLKDAGVELQNVEVCVLIDGSSPVSESEDGIATTQDGLLGMSFLKHFQFNADYGSGAIFFQKIQNAADAASNKEGV